MAAFPPGAVRDVGSEAELDTITSAAKTGVFFWAAWHEPSKPGGQMDTVWNKLAELHGPTGVRFARVEAEAVPTISERFGISVVPTFVLVEKGGKVAYTVEGADAPALTQKVQAFAAGVTEAAPEPAAAAAGDGGEVGATGDLNARLAKLIDSAPAILFMKGEPRAPRCGFSRKIVGLLEEHKVPFSTFDILQDEEVRQGLKTYSNWPTYPQLYVNGELIGGIDIVQEMAQEGDLAEQLGVTRAEQ
eukprot:TRINITY_DN29157_c0_g1_i1.p2 TRINITY_DN29157_c0_g1~~TRINITY_DN29157_c0_g1_i1.p2  ORF type:complete len:246 (-),score=60.32 TRINITY_DN29157_c0_g1_i1:372-1109(-)